MDLFLFQNIKKIITLCCLLMYIIFSLLGNVGAVLCYGTDHNNHIGLHVLSYDSCSDGKICNNIKSKETFNVYQNKFNYGHFQLNLNKIPPLNFNELVHCVSCFELFIIKSPFEEKYNKTDWNVYDDWQIPSPLKEFENIVLII